ncbi:hypothetical protein CEXT_255591 [Caerostris extrusa]|uniref:Uncharacterized protein n=1 Tax=Caerostris extrusa TaxID=172846 RepID=A0AAV4TRP9_CAEEX|nr:hypothetical protein CEXT_255591 [Caerostris extrusa]
MGTTTAGSSLLMTATALWYRQREVFDGRINRLISLVNEVPPSLLKGGFLSPTAGLSRLPLSPDEYGNDHRWVVTFNARDRVLVQTEREVFDGRINGLISLVNEVPPLLLEGGFSTAHSAQYLNSICGCSLPITAKIRKVSKHPAPVSSATHRSDKLTKSRSVNKHPAPVSSATQMHRSDTAPVFCRPHRILRSLRVAHCWVVSAAFVAG